MYFTNDRIFYKKKYRKWSEAKQELEIEFEFYLFILFPEGMDLSWHQQSNQKIIQTFQCYLSIKSV